MIGIPKITFFRYFIDKHIIREYNDVVGFSEGNKRQIFASTDVFVRRIRQ